MPKFDHWNLACILIVSWVLSLVLFTSENFILSNPVLKTKFFVHNIKRHKTDVHSPLKPQKTIIVFCKKNVKEAVKQVTFQAFDQFLLDKNTILFEQKSTAPR